MSTWSFRSVSLDTLGTVTLVSDSFKMPKKRGGNVLIPDLDGRVHTKKRFDQRVMALGLELVEESIQALEAKIDVVKALLAPSDLGTLSQTLEDLTIRTIEAEYTGELEPTRISPVSAKFLLEFTMPKPFFRSTILVSDVHTINANPTTYDITNSGTVYEREPKIVLTGPLDHPTITNTRNSVSLSYNGVITAGHYVTIDKNSRREYTALDDLGANVIGNIAHAGDSAFMVLEVGVNPMSVADSTHTTGTVTIEFYPPKS